MCHGRFKLCNFFIFLISFLGGCDKHFTEVRSTFSSPSYPSSYPVAVACHYTFHLLPGYCSIEYTFIDFFLEPPGTGLPCTRDYLEISGVRYCGQQLRGATSRPWSLFFFNSSFYKTLTFVPKSRFLFYVLTFFF